MKKNPFFLIISLIALGLVIGLSFIFLDGDLSNDVLTHVDEVFIPYLIAKIFFGLALVGVTAWIFLSEKARGHGYALLIATYSVQFIPLLLRLALLMAKNGVSKGGYLAYEIILLGLSAIAYIGFIGLVYYQDKKMVASDHKYEGKTIAVVSEEESRAKEGGIKVVSEEESRVKESGK